VIGIDIGKNSFHIVGLDDRGAIVLRQEWSRGQIEVRLANMPPCLIGMEACVGARPTVRPAGKRAMTMLLTVMPVGLSVALGLGSELSISRIKQKS
jgi:hypothetical protein